MASVLLLVASFVLWYSTSALGNGAAKVVLTSHPSPLLLCIAQFGVASAVSRGPYRAVWRLLGAPDAWFRVYAGIARERGREF